MDIEYQNADLWGLWGGANAPRAPPLVTGLLIIGRFRDGLPVLKIRLNRRKKLDGLFGEERYSREGLRTVRTARRKWTSNVSWTAQLTNTLSSNSTVQTKF